MADFDTPLTRLIHEAASRALFVSAWADREEEQGRHYPGKDLMDVAPATPTAALYAGAALIGKVEQANGLNLAAIYCVACTADKVGYLDVVEAARHPDDQNPENVKLREHAADFGFCMAMEGLGHGVGWTDSHEEYIIHEVGKAPRDPVIPYVEFYLDARGGHARLKSPRSPSRTTSPSLGN